MNDTHYQSHIITIYENDKIILTMSKWLVSWYFKYRIFYLISIYFPNYFLYFLLYVQYNPSFCCHCISWISKAIVSICLLNQLFKIYYGFDLNSSRKKPSRVLFPCQTFSATWVQFEFLKVSAFGKLWWPKTAIIIK